MNSEEFPYLTKLALAWKRAYGPLPKDYLCFDLETSGFDSKVTFVLQTGYCDVRNCKVVKREATRLAWEELLPDNKLKLLNVMIQKTHSKRKWVSSVGVEPTKAIRDFCNIVKANPVVVSFNGWRFDVPIFNKEAEAFGESVTFRATNHIDAGAIVKAAREGTIPRLGESYKDFTARALGTKSKTKWSLHDYWRPTVGIMLPPGEEAHDASTDAWLTHRVIEWFRMAGNQNAR